MQKFGYGVLFQVVYHLPKNCCRDEAVIMQEIAEEMCTQMNVAYDYVLLSFFYSVKINFYFFYRQPHMIWRSDFGDWVLLIVFYVAKYQTN